MANVMRYRHYDTDPVVSEAVLSAVEIEIGDLVYQDSNGNVYPASRQQDYGNEISNQQLFACRFLGVAEQQSRVGDTDPIRVGTLGVWEFICPALTVMWPLGTRVAPDENAAGTGLLDQTVNQVFSDLEGIGRIQRIGRVGDTSVLVRIRSEIMEGGLDPGTCESSSSAL